MSEHNPVAHPRHYTSHQSGVEVITYTRLLPFNIGNAVKYVMRRDLKGRGGEDIDKAIWYLSDAEDHGISYEITPQMTQVILPVLTAEPHPTVCSFLATLLYRPSGFSTTQPDLQFAASILGVLREEYA